MDAAVTRDVATQVGVGLILMFAICWVCSKLLGLKSPPLKRTFWTTAPAFLIVSMLPFSEFSKFHGIPNALIQFPGAALFFVIYYHGFKRSWLDDECLPDGVALENSDWRVGILTVLTAGGVVLALLLGRAVRELMS